ncbi:MAG: hypothetical protein P1U34_02325 [Coxiellaceae bacterium]|nr:hypothetical protein [Coxiellaceae bacterium]MDF1865529.1 hypothetical protein [Saprospiraceae bacterium]
MFSNQKRRELNKEHLYNSLRAFYKMRKASNECEDKYLERLSGFNKNKDRYLDVCKKRCFNTSRVRVREIAGSIVAGIKRVLKFCSMTPIYFRQYYIIHRLSKRGRHEGILLIALSSSRLPIPKQTTDVQKWFEEVLTPLEGIAHHNEIKDFLSNDVKFIFDPKKNSQFWSKRKYLWAIGGIIIDENFLLASIICYFLVSPIRFFGVIRDLRYFFRKKIKSQYGLSLKYFLFCNIFFISFNELLKKESKLRSVFLTNNSITTELLRIYLIQDMRCEKIIEVTHGVVSTVFETYIAELFDVASLYNYLLSNRHYFVLQLPGTLVSKTIQRQMYTSHFCINTYVNNYFLLLDNKNKVFEGLLSQLNELGLGRGRVTIVTVFGNHPRGKNLNTSDTLLLEIKIMTIILNLMSKVGDFQIVYVPHPIIDLKNLSHDFFKHSSITICNSSTFCYLFSDLVVSLISSTSFEASYFGAESVMPIIPNDGFFTKETLSEITYPENDSFESFMKVLTLATKKVMVSPRERVENKMLLRLEKVGIFQ